MEKDKECVLNISVFNKYWELLLLNYNQKNTHKIEQKRLLCYSIFKNTCEKDFEIAIKNTIINQQFFPNINEIYKYLPTPEEKIQQKIKNWENVKVEFTNEEEQQELKKMLEIK